MEVLGSLEKPWKMIASIKKTSSQTFIMSEESAPIINGIAQFTKLAFSHMTPSLIVEFSIEAKDALNL